MQEKTSSVYDFPLHFSPKYAILMPVEKPSKPRSYRLFRRFPA